MSSAERIVAIINPTAGRGRAARRWSEAEPVMRRRFSRLRIVRTEGPGHATVITRAALEEGVGVVVSVGGDGTANEVLGGFVDDEGHNRFPEAELGLLGGGTGGDFLRQLGSPPWSEQLDALGRPGSAIDYGVMRFVDHEGRSRTRPFLNAASAGLTGHVVARVLRAGPLSRRLLGAHGIYVWSSVREIMAYRNRRVRITVDGVDHGATELLLIAVANGRFFGGGMKVAPDAVVDDGRLEVVYAGGLSAAAVLGLLPKIFGGHHVDHPAVVAHRGQRVRIESLEPDSAPVLVELDGEQPGHLPASLWIVPGGLRLRVAGRSPAVVRPAGEAATP